MYERDYSVQKTKGPERDIREIGIMSLKQLFHSKPVLHFLYQSVKCVLHFRLQTDKHFFHNFQTFGQKSYDQKI